MSPRFELKADLSRRGGTAGVGAYLGQRAAAPPHCRTHSTHVLFTLITRNCCYLGDNYVSVSLSLDLRPVADVVHYPAMVTIVVALDSSDMRAKV